MSRDFLDGDGRITRQRSEILNTCDQRQRTSRDAVFRQKTFDDLFRERFIPLDSRKKVGSYVLGRIIGEGSFSKVRQSKHVDTQEKVAVKIIPKKTILQSEEARRGFIRETRTLRILAHKNIVRLHDVMETAGNYYLVMDLLHGENFKQFLNTRKVLTEVASRPLVHQVADALHYMHSLNVVHRDLKPDNLIISGEKITMFDFGLSACVELGSLMSTQCGSPAYAAPEIFSKQPYTKLVDIWSLGVIVFQMLTGCLPYNCKVRSYAHLHAIIMKGYSIPHSVQLSTECEDLISKLMAVDPGSRISASGVLAHPWLQTSTDQPQDS